jgi:DNA polymerase-3 subunit gamma/tau
LSGDLTALECRIQKLEEELARGAIVRSGVAEARQQTAPAQRAPERKSAKTEKPIVDTPPWEEPVKAAAPADVPPWEELPPLPEEPPMREEPGERVFDIPDEPPARPAPPVRAAAPARTAAPAVERTAVPAAPSAAPAEKAVPGAAVDSGWWKALAETCKGRLSPMYRPFMDRCTGVLEGDQLTVYVVDEITLNRLDNDRIKGILKEEAERTAGITLRVLLRVGEAPKASPQENLKNLLKFGSRFDNIEIK